MPTFRRHIRRSHLNTLQQMSLHPLLCLRIHLIPLSSLDPILRFPRPERFPQLISLQCTHFRGVGQVRGGSGGFETFYPLGEDVRWGRGLDEEGICFGVEEGGEVSRRCEEQMYVISNCLVLPSISLPSSLAVIILRIICILIHTIKLHITRLRRNDSMLFPKFHRRVLFRIQAE